MKIFKQIFSTSMIGTWILALFTCGVLWGVTMTHHKMTLDRDAALATMHKTSVNDHPDYKGVGPPFTLPAATPVQVDFVDGIEMDTTGINKPLAWLER
jgi:hypothetical protein